MVEIIFFVINVLFVCYRFLKFKFLIIYIIYDFIDDSCFKWGMNEVVLFIKGVNYCIW